MSFEADAKKTAKNFHHIAKNSIIYSKTALIKFKMFFIKYWVPKMRDVQEAFYKLKIYS